MPTIIIVQGAPGVGKTTLTRRLAHDLELGVVAKDDLKELLFETLGHPVDREESQIIGKAVIEGLFAITHQLATGRRNFIVECAFQPEFAAADTASLQEKATLVQVYCSLDAQENMRRFNQRITSGERHLGHLDTEQTDEAAFAAWGRRYGALPIADTITVDTADLDKSYDGLLQQLQERC